MKSIIIYLALITFAATTGADYVATNLIVSNPYLAG
jgi:hypothetical protein